MRPTTTGRRVPGPNSTVWHPPSPSPGFISKVLTPHKPPFFFPGPLLTPASDAVHYSRKKDEGSVTGKWFAHLASTSPWFKDMVPSFRVLDKAELPPSVDSGVSYSSLCINTMVYLPYLLGLCLKNGATITRTTVSHIGDAAALHSSGKRADLVVNCTGLLAAKLGGVMDAAVYPIRGQVVVVRNSPGVMLSISGTDDAGDELCYIMQRGAGGGTVLGGTYQKGQWESQPDPATAVRIMKRAVELCPQLTNGGGIEKLSIIRHGVGLRPYRDGGVRVETEVVDGLTVVHNYGHGGWGYQGSYGCSGKVVELVDDALQGGVKAKL